MGDTTSIEGSFPALPLNRGIPRCPECGSGNCEKNGHRYLKTGEDIQRWSCKDCGVRFSPLQKTSEGSLNTPSGIVGARQLCATIGEKAKKLVAATEIKTVAGEKKLQTLPPEARGPIAKFMAYLEREGYYEDSCYLNLLSTLTRRNTDLSSPEDVKTKIAQQKWKDSTKMLASHAYDLYCKMEGIKWTMPRYRQNEAVIWLPQSEADFDQLISYSHSRRMRAFLQALRETFADPGEILGLEWKDLKDNAISISKPCKGHYPGTIEVTPRCIAILRALPKTDKRIFPTTYGKIYSNFRSFRKRAAKQLQNDQLLNVTFKTFRHWGGTDIAIRTNGNGLLTIQKVLRHKDIKSTMKYIHNMPNFKEIDYEIATATTDEEIKALGKAGFEKYDEAKGIHYYRRIPRKTTGVKPR